MLVLSDRYNQVVALLIDCTCDRWWVGVSQAVLQADAGVGERRKRIWCRLTRGHFSSALPLPAAEISAAQNLAEMSFEALVKHGALWISLLLSEASDCFHEQ